MRTARAIPLLAVAAAATIAASSPSRADTMYLYDTDLGKRRGNDAEVCHFSFAAENFEAGQQTTWWVENASGTDALRGALTMDATGAAVTGPISLANGTYRLFWATGTDKARRFTVNCAQASTQSTGAASATASASSSASTSAGVTAPASRSASASASVTQSAEPSGKSSGRKTATSATPGAALTPAPGTSADGGPVQDGQSLSSGSSMAGAGLLAIGGVLAVVCLVVSEVLLRRSWRRR